MPRMFCIVVLEHVRQVDTLCSRFHITCCYVG